MLEVLLKEVPVIYIGWEQGIILGIVGSAAIFLFGYVINKDRKKYKGERSDKKKEER